MSVISSNFERSYSIADAIADCALADAIADCALADAMMMLLMQYHRL